MVWRNTIAMIGCVAALAALAATAAAQDGFDPAGWAKRFQERAIEQQADRLGLSQ